MKRDFDLEAAILINDLDSVALRLEHLQPHPRYTDAVVAVRQAKAAVEEARSDLHRADMDERFATLR